MKGKALTGELSCAGTGLIWYFPKTISYRCCNYLYRGENGRETDILLCNDTIIDVKLIFNLFLTSGG